MKANLTRLQACTLVMLSLSIPALALDSEQLQRELAESRRMQERMMQQLQDQSRRIERLEARLADSEAGADTPAARPTVDLATPSTGEAPVTWSQVSLDRGSQLRIYGFLRGDAIYDTSRANNAQTIGFVRSEDPKAPAGIGAPSDVNNFTLHPRLTRLGIDLNGPEIEKLFGAKASGKVEVDFYGGGSESRSLFRMRHAYTKLAWGDFSMLVGQTFDVISPLYPSANPDLAMWGAGNLGDRRPQVRLEWAPEVGPGKLNWRGAIGLPGANDLKDIDPGGTTGAGFRDGETSGFPVFQTRLAYSLPFIWDQQNVELGAWAHRAWDEPDTSLPIGGPGDDDVFDSYALGLDFQMPFWQDKLWFKGEMWYGKNLTDVRGGIFQGINTGTGDEVYARGGWAEVGARFIPWWTTAAGYTTDDPTDGDLPVGGRAANDVFYLTNRWKFDPITLGFDWQNWRTDYVGYSRGTNDRFQWFLQYDF